MKTSQGQIPGPGAHGSQSGCGVGEGGPPDLVRPGRSGRAVSRDPMDEGQQFRRLQDRLPRLWRAIVNDTDFRHTALVVPSLSVDQVELAKIDGAAFYEERLLFSLMRLRHPGARVIYVTSQAVHPDIVDYYLQLLHGLPVNLARQRLEMLCVQDSGPRPLTDKILERPLLLERIRRLIGRRNSAYLTCFNSSYRERRLAIQLGIPLNSVDPDLLSLGTKSGSRCIFAAAQVPHPLGYENLASRQALIAALRALGRERPGIQRAVIKLNHSFSGEGNAIYEYPRTTAIAAVPEREALNRGLQSLRFAALCETPEGFLTKLADVGGIVEDYVEAKEVRSPSVQLRIYPDRRLEIVSTHDQVLDGPTKQTYLGCCFPADIAYRQQITELAWRVGDVLRDRGVIGRFGIDFVATREAGANWAVHAIEINLRMGGTTPPFLALQFLTGGALDDQGYFVSRAGKRKFYRATDHLKSPHYRGILPEDLIEKSVRAGIRYDPSTESGVLFHMIGALSQYGKLGVTCIADQPDGAEALYRRTVSFLDVLSGVAPRGRRHAPLLDRPWTGME